MSSVFYKANQTNENATIPCDSKLRCWPMFVIALTACLIVGCSKSNTAAQVEDELRIAPIDPGVLAEISTTVALPAALQDLQAGSELLTPVPTIVAVEILAESGLQVAYTDERQSALVPALSVEDNWLYMQNCLNQVGVAPLVLVRSDEVAPFTSSDDVVYTIDSVPAATASSGSIPVIQIGVSDFLITGNAKAYNLRSIMGRLLWSSAGLLARDYPFSCARQWVETG